MVLDWLGLKKAAALSNNEYRPDQGGKMLLMGRLASELVGGAMGYVRFSVCSNEGEGHLGCESFRVSIGVDGRRVEAFCVKDGSLIGRVHLAVRRAMGVDADRRFAALSQFLTDLAVEFETSLRLELNGMTPADMGTMSWCCSQYGPTQT